MNNVVFADCFLKVIVLKGHFSATFCKTSCQSKDTVQRDKVHRQHITKAVRGVIAVA